MSTILYLAIPAFIVLQIVEVILIGRRPPARALRGYEARDSVASLTLGVANVLISLVTKGATLGALYLVGRFALFDLGFEGWVWLLLIPVEDFCYYWFHRLHHEVRVLWAAHVNHHSSRRFNLSTALRQSWTTPFTGPLFWWPLALVGFEPLMILTAQSISLIYQFWIHTETIGRLGPLEWVLNTPSHHRVHHGRNVAYLDRNYGGIFIVWDRLFGSFEPEHERVDYGLTKNVEGFHPLWLAFHEWIALLRDLGRAASWREAFAYLLQPPGWSPDGHTLTARQMQAQRALPALTH